MKILVAAYACNPFHGSEDSVGWGWVNALARQHEVWVLTGAFNQPDVGSVRGSIPGDRDRLHFVSVEERFWHYRPNKIWNHVEKSMLKPILNWAYGRWLRDASRLAKQLHSDIGFDLAHQLTFVGFRFPGHLWKLGIPFVWGPIGGLENMPWRLLPAMGPRGAAYYAARNVVNSAHKRFLRGPREAFRQASAVIAATSGIQREIYKWYGVPSDVICEVGFSCDQTRRPARRTLGEPLRISWSGRHLPGKALHLLLRALSRMPEQLEWRLDVFGDGPCRSGWQALASRLGVAARCTWHGQVSRDEALNGLRRSHVFVVTSLKDLTSTVIIEALACGVAVICPDHCGFSDAITDQCGFKLPIPTARVFETGLAAAISELASNEELRRRLAAGALRRAQEYSWQAKAAAIERVYQRALAVHSAASVQHVLAASAGA